MYSAHVRYPEDIIAVKTVILIFCLQVLMSHKPPLLSPLTNPPSFVSPYLSQAYPQLSLTTLRSPR